MKVEFYRHSVGEAEIASLTETLKGIFLTTGPKTAQVEETLAAHLGAKGAVGLTSCTMAAFLTLKAWGIGPGDEVIVPAMTFIATSNVVLHCGATPVFADVRPGTGNIDPADVERRITPRTKAIMPVHLYGHMADMRALREIADRHGLKILEDAAHCVEGERDGVRPGGLGDAVCFSFYATKNLTCGEGGAAASNDEELIARLKSMRLHGMSKSAAQRYTATYQHWDMAELGYKANMSDIQAALLLNQLATMDGRLARREAISRRYAEAFGAAGIEHPAVRPDTVSARHLFTVWAPPGKRDDMLAALQQREIGVAVNYRAVPGLSYYREELGCDPADYPVAQEIGDRTLTLPLYPGLTDEEVEYVIAAVTDVYADLS